MIVAEDSYLYRTLADKFIFNMFLVAVGLYVLSYFLADFNWPCDGQITQHLCGIKLEEYQKSSLDLDRQMSAYIYLSNFLLFIAPILLIPFLFKEKFRTLSLSSREKMELLKLVIYTLVIGVIFWFLAYVAPFTQIASAVIFNNKITYILINSLAVIGVLLMQYFFFCMARTLVVSK